MIKKILIGVSAAIVLLVAVLIVRTMSYGGTPDGVQQVQLPEPPSISAEAAAQNLSRAIQFRTITLRSGDPREGQEGPWLELQAWLEDTYPAFHAAAPKETVPGGYTVLYTWEGSDTSLDPLLLMAHQDVVPVNIGTEGDWTGAPFAGEIVDGYIYGRGAMDDKGSLVALMEALNALAEDGFQPQRTILVQLGHDEEVSGSGAEAGIALLKSRGVTPVMALDEGFMVIEDNPITGGTLGLIGVAEKGYLTVQLTVTAAGGHSSAPPKDSATVRLSRALIALDENQMPADLAKAPTSDMMAVISTDLGFVPRMAMANQWLFGGMVEGQFSGSPQGNAMVRTTTAPTMLSGSAKENVLAQRATAIVNFRVHPNNTIEDVLAHIGNVTSDIEGLEYAPVDGGIGSEASPVSATDNRAYGVLNAVARATGDGAPVAPALVIGATDARYASAITEDVYRFAPSIVGPADLAGFHGTNERLSVENMGNLSRGYAQIILAMDEPEPAE
ncbi:M20 family peptidase [Henriciella marina]|uniref:M20 family peptidase n=1 Tax=Henriciella marina TaxID=453851 RepID=UPI0003680A4B|nr:M20 family peptidase [Henriciella marina]